MTQGNDQLTRIEKMLRNILRSDGHIHRIGGYVYGQTSNNDPYVILYPAGDMLEHKAVRVYKEQLRFLPDFIPVDEIPDDAGGGNPDKSKAQKKGIYHECPPFEVLTYDGKDTQMGKEKRFSSVLQVLPQRAQTPPPQATPPVSTTVTPPPTTAPTTVAKPTPPAPPPASTTAKAGKGDPAEVRKHWMTQGYTSRTMFDLLTAIEKIFPEVSSASITKTAELFMQNFDENTVLSGDSVVRLTNGIVAYWDYRATHAASSDTHKAAVAAAKQAYNAQE